MHYVVAGTGYAGRRALQALPGASGISRSKRPGLSDRRILLRDLDAESIAPIDISAPYSLLYTIPPPEGGDSDPRLARLLAALKHVPARIVYIGTSGVYGDQAGGWVHEDSETKPTLSRARRRWDAEKPNAGTIQAGSSHTVIGDR